MGCSIRIARLATSRKHDVTSVTSPLPLRAHQRRENCTRDGRWTQLLNIHPRTKTAALAFLGTNDDPRAIGEAVRRWEGLELEEAANRAGLQATMVRTVEEFMAEEQFGYLAAMDLVEIKKIADSNPVFFT